MTTAGGLGAAHVGPASATRADGTELVSHEAFWLAWSQFDPDTLVWTGP